MRISMTSAASRLLTWSLSVALLLAAVCPLPAAAADEPFGDRSTCPINNQPDSITRCFSQTGSLPFTCSWAGFGRARWYVDGNLAWEDPNTSNSSTYIHTGRASASIECRWSSAICGITWSNAAQLTVLGPNNFKTHPVGQAQCATFSVTFSVALFSSTGTQTYQWRKGTTNLVNSPGRVSGATTNTLTIANLNVNDAGLYNCVVTDQCGSNASNNAQLVVNGTPVITDQPDSQNVCPGQFATLQVQATSSTPLTYFWFKAPGILLTDGPNVFGATTGTLILWEMDPEDAGSYWCFVGNACSGYATSETAVVTVGGEPTITVQPQATSACAGTNVSLSITATSSLPLSYQWTKGGEALTDGNGVSGATTPTLTLSSIDSGDQASYRCRVSSGCSSVLSNSASLSVSSLAITTQPVAVTQCVGTNASFSVVAIGTPTPTYQWRKGNANLSDVPNQISGANTATLTLLGIDSNDADGYSCVVTNGCSSIVSSGAALTVNTTPTIVTQPVATTTCPGTNAQFAVVASGTPNPTYQWRRGTTNLTNVAGQISGATSATLTLIAIDINDVASYSCVVSSPCSSVTTASAALTMKTPPTILTQPAAVTACSGTNASFTVIAFAEPLATYQWRNGSINLANIPGQVSGATSPTLVLSSIDSFDAGSYTCVVSNECSVVISSAASLTVNTAPSITTQPVPSTQCAGTEASFTVAATGTPSPTFQWRKGTVNLTNVAGRVAGANSPTLTLSALESADAANYSCVVTNACSSVTSNAVALTVRTGPSITQQPSPLTRCAGNSNATFSVVVTGATPLTYRWQKNGQDLSNMTGQVSGATSASLTLIAVDANDAATYRCVITNSCGSTTSTDAVLVVNTGPSITAHPQNASSCASSTASFSIATDDPSPDYQWQWRPQGSTTWLDLTNGDNLYENSPRLSVAGATASTLEVTPIAGAGSLASFRCVLGNSCNSTTSDPAAILICASDLTCDTLVDNSDFLVFVVAYNTFDCADPTMPTHCPADLDRDGVVDLTDFQIFIVAYDQLVCS